MNTIKECCEKLAKEQKDEYVGVFSYTDNPSKLTIDTDGILQDIVFCPYCGKKLEIEKGKKVIKR